MNNYNLIKVDFQFSIIHGEPQKVQENDPNTIVINKVLWDSICSVARSAPFVKIDTVYIKGETKYIERVRPIAVLPSKDTAITNYRDSIVNEDIDVRVSLAVKGSLNKIQWEYTPMTREVTEIIEKQIPQIIQVPIETKVAKTGLYIYGITGGNTTSFLFGAGADIITKKDRVFGYQYQRYGNSGFHSLKIGIKIW